MEAVKLPLGGGFALREVGQIDINVKNLERAASFYREVLRLPQLYCDTARMAFFDAAGVRLALSVAERAEFDHPSSLLYFTVADIRAGYQALVERGVRFTQPPVRTARLEHSEVWMAFFRDSEGNVLAIMSEEAIAAGRG